MLEIKVHQIKGFCPVYKKGDRITVDDPEIVLDKTEMHCAHMLYPHYCITPRFWNTMWCPVKLGLTTKKDKDCAYLQCVDPGKPFTDGGSVVFNCKKISKD